VGLSGGGEAEAPEEQQEVTNVNEGSVNGTPGKGGAQKVVHCVARGSWGTCLPVSVVQVDVADGSQLGILEEEREEGAKYIALTVSDRGPLSDL
jgi:hypothetical protein